MNRVEVDEKGRVKVRRKTTPEQQLEQRITALEARVAALEDRLGRQGEK